MRADIHPVYPFSTITCACGAAYEMRTTRGKYTVEICANCHPFFTGKQKLLDTEGRVDRFNRKYKRAMPAASAMAGAPPSKA